MESAAPLSASTAGPNRERDDSTASTASGWSKVSVRDSMKDETLNEESPVQRKRREQLEWWEVIVWCRWFALV